MNHITYLSSDKFAILGKPTGLALKYNNWSQWGDMGISDCILPSKKTVCCRLLSKFGHQIRMHRTIVQAMQDLWALSIFQKHIMIKDGSPTPM